MFHRNHGPLFQPNFFPAVRSKIKALSAIKIGFALPRLWPFRAPPDHPAILAHLQIFRKNLLRLFSAGRTKWVALFGAPATSGVSWTGQARGSAVGEKRFARTSQEMLEIASVRGSVNLDCRLRVESPRMPSSCSASRASRFAGATRLLTPARAKTTWKAIAAPMRRGHPKGRSEAKNRRPPGDECYAFAWTRRRLGGVAPPQRLLNWTAVGQGRA
jgi:hypothetical protein